MNRRRVLVYVGASLGILLAHRLNAHDAPYGSSLDGQPITALASPQARCVVLISIATDCPVSNRYLPEIARLATRYRAHAVRFWLVYPNPGDSPDAVRLHRQHYPDAAAVDALLTPSPALLRASRVHVTPEAAIFANPLSGQPAVWHGRIDDRYLSFGRQRPAAVHHDLADAVEALLAGRTPLSPAAPPVGCAIIPRV